MTFSGREGATMARYSWHDDGDAVGMDPTTEAHARSVLAYLDEVDPALARRRFRKVDAGGILPAPDAPPAAGLVR